MKILYHSRTRKGDQEKCLGKDWRDSTLKNAYYSWTSMCDHLLQATAPNKQPPIQNSVKTLKFEPLVNDHLTPPDG